MSTPNALRAVLHLLQGRPLGHPLHPLLVHAPVGLFVLSLLFDLGTRFVAPDNRLVQGAVYTLGLGLLIAFAAAVTGAADWADIRADHPASRIANAHLVLNLGALGLYVINFVLRLLSFDAAAAPWLPLSLSVAGMGLLGISGYLGGRLVYDNGIGVGRHRRRTASPTRTISLSQAGAGAGVPVVEARRLAPGETLRVEIDGVVLVVANVDGQFVAFQEFCTHRYGPLSEGRLHAGQIECPWHRSCFDVRSGQVTHGPAKVSLRTFPVAVVAGVVQVTVAQAGPVPANGDQPSGEPQPRSREATPT